MTALPTLGAFGEEPKTDESIPALRATTWEHRFVLGAELACSTASATYEAYDLVLGRSVSLQQLRSADATPTALHPAEVFALSAIDHPAIVRVYEVSVDSSRPFVVRDLPRGRSLAELLLRGRLPFARALPLLRQVAAGLDALHAAGIVHGDVTPSNVRVERGTIAKLTEVGLAPFLYRAHPEIPAGTAAYLGPERALAGAAERTLRPSSDVYAFGVLCFEVLTGRLPFLGATPAELRRAHELETPPLASRSAPVSESLDLPLALALAKKPEDRLSSCTAIVDALAATGPGVGAGARLRVVVADDDGDQRALVTTILDAYLPGVEVVVCACGPDVLDAVSEKPTAVALVDLTMPAPSGLDLVRLIRDVSPATTVVIVTGQGSGPERTVARALGVRRFLVKPVEVDELLLAVREGAASELARRAG